MEPQPRMSRSSRRRPLRIRQRALAISCALLVVTFLTVSVGHAQGSLPDLSIEKYRVPHCDSSIRGPGDVPPLPPVVPGQVIHYRLDAINLSLYVADDVRIRDTLSDLVTYISSEIVEYHNFPLPLLIQGGPDQVIWVMDRLHGFEQLWLCVTVQVDADAPIGDPLENEVNIETFHSEHDPSNNVDRVIDLVTAPVPLDFGDAPDPLVATAGEYPTLLVNNGARHEIGSGLHLGAAVDAEPDGQPGIAASGDDLAGDTPDDEDGVVLAYPFLHPGSTTYLTVSASAAGSLDAWVDFNNDGDWDDAGEQVFTSLVVTAGSNDLSFAVPAGAVNAQTYARFRLSSAGGLSPEGYAFDGEVEDYAFTIAPDTFHPFVASTNLAPSYTTGPTSLTVTFSENVSTSGGSAGADSATNPDNYRLLEEGTQAGFQTTACDNIDLINDNMITIDSVSYVNNSFTSTLLFNAGAPLPDGIYRLLVCGTTSIEDPAGNILNDGGDSTFDFTVQAAPIVLPDTGFPRGQFTSLPLQPASKAYTTSALMLDIPALNVAIPIVGVPQYEGRWDVSWLGNRAGYLEGSAFPTWSGNTVLTAHVYGSYGLPGPFMGLGRLRWGDEVVIHAWGLRYIYEVRESFLTRPSSQYPLQHEEYDWVTLLTCERYDALRGNYAYRRVVRAVLIEVGTDWPTYPRFP